MPATINNTYAYVSQTSYIRVFLKNIRAMFYPLKDGAQTASFKDPVRTAL
jgi:hypothetical protein